MRALLDRNGIVADSTLIHTNGRPLCVTVEREQLVARIEELAALLGLSNRDEQLTGHRD